MQVWMRWIWPGLFTTALITALAIWSTRDVIEADLSERFRQAAQSGGLNWAQIELEGRDAIISGEAPDQTEIDLIGDLVAMIPEIRIFRDEATVLPEQDDYTLNLEKSGGDVTLKGYYPYEMRDGALAGRIAEKLPSGLTLSDETELGRGAPDGFVDRALYAAELLKQLSDGTVVVRGDELSVSGQAAGHEAYVALRKLEQGDLPKGLKLSQLDVAPALAQPFTFSVSRQDGATRVEGFVPDESTRDELLDQLALALPGNDPEDELKIAVGAPEDFGAYARFAIDQLARLDSGEVTVIGTQLSLQGDAASRETFADLRNALTQGLPDGLTVADRQITPPLADTFTWTVSRKDGQIALAGSVPSERARDAMIAQAEEILNSPVDAGELFIERGAPADFEAITAAALANINNFSDGLIEMFDDGRLAVEGRAKNSDAYQDVIAAFEKFSSAGSEVSIGDFTPPAASPYITNLSKSGGTLTLSGSVPDIATRDEFLGRMEQHSPGLTIVDDSTFASGAPDTLAQSVSTALEGLGILDAGAVTIAPDGLKIDGDLADADASERFDVFLKQHDPSIASEVRPVTRAPYDWSASRNGPTVTFRGSVPSAALQEGLAAAVGETIADVELSDETEIREDAPDGFAAGARRVTALLGRMSEGSARFSEGQFTLSGKAETPIDFDAILADIAQAPAIAGVIEPSRAKDDYLLSATRREGAISLSGSAPNVTARDELEQRAREAFPDANIETRIVVESGAPDSFLEQAGEAINRLTDLKVGEVSVLNDKLSISGTAETPDAYEALTEVLEEGGETVEGTVEPATVSPYTWSVERSEDGSRLSGFVPDTMAGRANEAAAKSVLGGEVDEGQRIAAGEPDDFANAVAALIGAAGQLDDSAASLSDKNAEIEGHASSQDRAERIGNRLEEDLEGLGYSLHRELTFPPPQPAPTTEPEADPVEEPQTETETQAEDAIETEDASEVTAEPAPESEAEPQAEAVEEPVTTDAPATAEAPAMDKADELAANEEQPAAPAAVTITPQARQACQQDLDGIMGDGDIRFATSKAVIKRASYPVLDRLAAALKECGAVELEIGGHTDSRGTERYNRGLSEARATSVRKYLASLGVDTSAISVKGYGESEPLATNETPTGRSANRRIEFKLAQ